MALIGYCRGLSTLPLTFFYANLGLARRLELACAQAAEAHAAAHRELYADSQACCLEVNGARASFVTADSPLTHVLNLGMTGPLEEGDLYEIEHFYEDRSPQVTIELCPLAVPDALELLVKRGYLPFQFENVLARPIPNETFAFTPSLPMLEPEAELWSRTLAKGFSEMDDPPEEASESGRVLHKAHGLRGFGIEIDGHLAAAGALEIRDQVATFCADATLPAARRRGAQTALIQNRLIEAQKAGCDIATAMVSPGSLSQHNYERHGFRVMYTRTNFAKIR